MGEIKRYIVVKMGKIIHATDSRIEALKVARNNSGGTFSCVEVFDCLTLETIYEWTY